MAVFLLFVVRPAFSADDKAVSVSGKDVSASVPNKQQAPDASAAKAKGLKDATVDELAERITMTLDRRKEVMQFVQGLKKETDPSGASYYTLNGTRLEKMSKDSLVALYGRIQQESTRINTERINKQLESIRRAQQATSSIANQASRTQAAAQQPRLPPSVPATQYNQPVQPKVPTPPPAPRKIT